MSQNNRYGLIPLYSSRSEYRHFDDLVYKDEWQKEVYLHAAKLMAEHQLRTVLDVGCGSAYKLLKYLGCYETIGLEVSPTLEQLKERYPERLWMLSDFSSTKRLEVDLVICADVIEHLLHPDELLEYLARIQCRFVVISTPARNLLYWPWNRGFYGPPRNVHHVREWTMREFGRYISRRFCVVEHRITNATQCTQMIVCRSLGSSAVRQSIAG